MRRLILGVAVFVLSAAGHASGADTTIVPGGLADTEGNSNFNVPFGRGRNENQRAQQVYLATEFSALGGPILITQITFRPDAQTGNEFSLTHPDVQINMSTTSRTPDNLSMTFAENVGQDDTVVVNRGPLELSSSNTGPPEEPKEFDIVITLDNPFAYDPSAGNLLLDVRVFTGGGQYGIQFDSQNTQGDFTSTVFSLSGQWGGGVDCPEANFQYTQGLVTKFTFEAITPEQAIEELIEDVMDINLANGVENSLDQKLDNALDAYSAENADQRQDAINKLDAFINSVEAQRGKKISEEDADFLVNAAQGIIANL